MYALIREEDGRRIRMNQELESLTEGVDIVQHLKSLMFWHKKIKKGHGVETNRKKYERKTQKETEG